MPSADNEKVIADLKPVFFVLALLLFLMACRTLTAFSETATPVPALETALPVLTASPSPAPQTIEPVPTFEALPGAAGLGDSFYPGFGNGGYDAQHYTLTLTVHNAHTSELEGQVALEAQATQNLSRFNLDFLGFTIDEITVDAQPASFDRDGQELSITPAQPLEAGQRFVVQVNYHGTPETLPSGTGWTIYNGGSYVLSEPDGAATWFPSNDHPLDKASYTFNITAPKPFVVAANGVLTKTTDMGKSTTFVWEEQQPMASYLAMVVIGEFNIETETAPNGIPIRNYYGAGLGRGIRKAYARQGEMLAFYADTFGAYPFDAYGSLILNTEIGTALETQTLSIFGADMVDLDDVASTEEVVAHEMAHQWFGDSLSVADWSDIWLNEGFATYAQGLWVEHTKGAKALDDWVKDEYAYTVETAADMAAPGKPYPDDLFNDGVYDRGALTLHALRLQVGDAAFFEILRVYVERFKGGNVRTSDFIAVAEEVSGQPLQSFFDDWLYSETIPPMPASR